MKGTNFGSIGSRMTNAAQHGISTIRDFFKKKVVENHVELPVELPVNQAPIIAERMDEGEKTPNITEPERSPKVKRLVEHDMPKASELKVVGKIDLDALNQRTRPIKKSRRQLERDRKKRANHNKATNDTNEHELISEN